MHHKRYLAAVISITISTFLFTLISKACISGPMPQLYFNELFSVPVPTDLPKGVEVELSPSEDIVITSSIAYPIYALTTAKDPTEIHQRDNIMFPAGLKPITALVARTVWNYRDYDRTWEVNRTFSEVEPYDPYFNVDLDEFGFSDNNIRSLDPDLNIQAPAEEPKQLTLMINSKLYKVSVIKSYVKNDSYKKDVIEQLRIDLQRTIERNNAQGSTLKRVFWLIFGRFLPQTKITNDAFC